MDERRGAAAPEFPDDPWLATLLAASLAEDVGAGDVTTGLAVDQDVLAHGWFTARSAGVAAGLPLLPRLYALLSDAVRVEPLVADGTAVPADGRLARIEGPAAPLLTGERVALNFLQRLGGVATLTARYVTAVAGTGCRILDTRKTLPGYRLLDKYAVRCGGGENHRLGLHDRLLLKDNHWAARRRPLPELVAEGRARHPGMVLEVEVDDMDQLASVLPLGVDWVLLDNFAPAAVRDAVAMRDAGPEAGRRTKLEVSGNVDLATVRGYAEAGADACSVGRLTHSAPAWDVGLDLVPTGGDR